MDDDVIRVLTDRSNKERIDKIELGVEEMITDPQQRGLKVIEDYLCNLVKVELDSAVPYGTVLIVRKADYLDDLDVTILRGIVPPPEGSGGEA